MKTQSKFLFSAIFMILVSLQAGFAVDKVKLDVTMVYPVLKADQRQVTHFKVGLEGFSMQGKRIPVNVAIVLDKSEKSQFRNCCFRLELCCDLPPLTPLTPPVKEEGDTGNQ